MGCVLQFFLLVTFFSVSEVSLLLWVASKTGLLFTMGCCVFTGLLGGYLVREQGLQTLGKIQQAINAGQIPADEAVEGLMLLVVGVLLCVPGFITDTLGFLIIVPFIRKSIAKLVVERIKAMIMSGQIKVHTPGFASENAVSSHEKADERIENAEIVEEHIYQGDEDDEKK